MTIAAESLDKGFAREFSAIDDEQPAAPTEATVADDASDVRSDPTPGRLHNRENPSPSEMAEMLREVQDSLVALDERLAGLEGVQGDSSVVTRRLALSVAEMGETLARRVRSLETGDASLRPQAPNQGSESASEPASLPLPFAAALSSRPAPAPPKGGSRMDTLVLILGFAVLIGLILTGLWVFLHQHAGGGSAVKPAAAVASHVAPAPPTAATPLSSNQPAAAPGSTTPRQFVLYPVRHAAAHRATAAAPTATAASTTAATMPASADPAPTGFRSFGPAATNSAQKPPG